MGEALRGHCMQHFWSGPRIPRQLRGPVGAKAPRNSQQPRHEGWGVGCMARCITACAEAGGKQTPCKILAHMPPCSADPCPAPALRALLAISFAVVCTCAGMKGSCGAGDRWKQGISANGRVKSGKINAEGGSHGIINTWHEQGVFWAGTGQGWSAFDTGTAEGPETGHVWGLSAGARATSRAGRGGGTLEKGAQNSKPEQGSGHSSRELLYELCCRLPRPR